MKLIFFAFFASGLSMATINTNFSLPMGQIELQECGVTKENLKRSIRYYPKKVCNIDKSSVDSPEKLSNFIAECTNSQGGWLLINSSEANYINEILH
jgi:hypothetical protein|tara:strand:+ start:58 stop:348 length:291 start_codon:yes stop_codon:yes gene_type:complete